MWLSSELWGRGEAIGGMTNGTFYYLVMDYLLIFIYLLVPRVPRKKMIGSSHFRVGKGEPPEHLKESEGEKSSCFLFVSKVSPASPRHWLNSSGYFHAFEAPVQSYLTHT